MMKLLRRFYRLTRLCITGPGGWIGVVQFLVIVGLGLIGVRIGVRLITWNADFYNALQKLDTPEAIRQIGIYFGLTAISVMIYLCANYLRKLLQIRWRRALTEAAMDRWLGTRPIGICAGVSMKAPTTPTSASPRTAASSCSD